MVAYLYKQMPCLKHFQTLLFNSAFSGLILHFTSHNFRGIFRRHYRYREFSISLKDAKFCNLWSLIVNVKYLLYLEHCTYWLIIVLQRFVRGKQFTYQGCTSKVVTRCQFTSGQTKYLKLIVTMHARFNTSIMATAPSNPCIAKWVVIKTDDFYSDHFCILQEPKAQQHGYHCSQAQALSLYQWRTFSKTVNKFNQALITKLGFIQEKFKVICICS